MTKEGDTPSDPRLEKALAHPLRAQALPLFGNGPTSPNQVARQLDVAVSILAYHIRVLRQLGYIELVGTKQRRGALEHFYRATNGSDG